MDDKIEDDFNFKFEVEGHTVEMENGELVVDNSIYEDNPEDTFVYDIVRAYRKLKENGK